MGWRRFAQVHRVEGQGGGGRVRGGDDREGKRVRTTLRGSMAHGALSTEQLPLNLVLLKNISIVGIHWGAYTSACLSFYSTCPKLTHRRRARAATHGKSMDGAPRVSARRLSSLNYALD
jgi:hypothetical protein